MKERFKARVAVYLFLREDNKILLLQRAGSGFMDGYYGLPAGHVENDETVKEAMVREAKEEINVDFNSEDLELKITMQRKTTDAVYIDFFFCVKKYRGTINNNEPEKCTDLKFFDINNLPENIVPYVAEAIEALDSGVNYLEHGF